MKGSPTLELDHSIQALIIEHLSERAPTISARRAARLCKDQGVEVVEQQVRSALEQLASEAKVKLVRKGVYRLTEAPQELDAQVERPSGSLSDEERSLLRRYQGKRAPAGASLSRADLEEAQRVASYLSPYPASPVDLEDIAQAEATLGRSRAHEALWLHLQEEVNVVCDLYQTPRVNAHVRSGLSPSPEVERAEPSVTRPPDEPSKKGQRRATQQRSIEEQTQALFSALKNAQQPLSLEGLSSRVHTERGRGKQALYELRKLLIDVNREATQRGARPPFTFEITGEVGLSEWGVSSSMRASEGRVARELELHKEQLFVSLAERLAQLKPTAFAKLLRRLLEELGCTRIERLNAPQEDGVALIAHHPEWGDCLTLAQRSKRPLSIGKIKEVARSLSALQADRALLISLSGFADCTTAPPPEVRLIGERDLLELMISHQIGVAQYTLPVSYLDVGFFGRIDEGGE